MLPPVQIESKITLTGRSLFRGYRLIPKLAPRGGFASSKTTDPHIPPKMLFLERGFWFWRFTSSIGYFWKWKVKMLIQLGFFSEIQPLKTKIRRKKFLFCTREKKLKKCHWKFRKMRLWKRICFRAKINILIRILK